MYISVGQDIKEGTESRKDTNLEVHGRAKCHTPVEGNLIDIEYLLYLLTACFGREMGGRRMASILLLTENTVMCS